MLQGLIEDAPIGENLTVTIERGGKRQDLVVRPQAQPVAGASGVPVAGTRVAPEIRSELPRATVRTREPQAAPRGVPPLPSPTPGDDVPSALEPIPRTDPPANGPSLELPKNQSVESPQ